MATHLTATTATDGPAGPADLALPLALVQDLLQHHTRRADEVRTVSPRTRAARRRRAAVRG
ncbi:hypothetical protein [Streptomyces paludis]|uniref:Uncharacterized protein n=1 Tax=Streptomyces paludis TaxID=2282738 RepID=A0A345HRJ9_9ACTN|nr:hypothetical protein [Streptomyces paludis]AXG79323.1 hypothetical protein DVK44_18550 [Streptomyces paludis]